MAGAVHVEVRRDAFADARTVATPLPAPADGEALLRVERFGLTANNVTYAALGDALRYWEFFPAADEGWGRVPVWGFATVEASGHDGVEPGGRYWGYLPMASHVLVRPDPLPTGFRDAAAHRAELSPVYNLYTRTDLDPGYDPAHEAAQMLMRPLFITSCLLDDVLARDGFGGAQRILLSSASSRTAYALAFLLARRGEGRPEVAGLTTPRNVAFAESLGFYDRVVAYEALAQLDAAVPTAYVDFAGDARLRAAVHRHLGDALVSSTTVGATHWDEAALDTGELPGPAPSFFFAPDHLRDRGPEFFASVAEAWRAFAGPFGERVAFEERRGPDAVRETWAAYVEGRADPRQGLLLSL